MRSNLSILERNTLGCFASETAKSLYLRGAQQNEYKALRMALEWDEKLEPFLSMFVPDTVVEFIAERQFRRYFPNN